MRICVSEFDTPSRETIEPEPVSKNQVIIKDQIVLVQIVFI